MSDYERPVTITVYTTPGCTQCKMLIRRLNKMGYAPSTLTLDKEDDSTAGAAYNMVVNDLGFNSAPLTVITGLYDNPVYFHGNSPTNTIALKSALAADDIAVVDSDLDPATGLPVGVTVNDLVAMPN